MTTEKDYADAIREGISLISAKDAEKMLIDALGINKKDRRRMLEKLGLTKVVHKAGSAATRNLLYTSLDDVDRVIGRITASSRQETAA
jgi:hypothetical protein